METVDVSSLAILDHDWVLDLGCGEGRHSIACRYHFPKANVVGLDLDFSSVRAARRKDLDFIHAAREPTYINASGHQLPFPDSSFDHVLCSEVLEHISEYTCFLEEIQRVLKPGGYLSISVPRAWPERICWALSRAYHQVEGGHVRIFDLPSLEEELRARQFRILHKHWAHALHTPYWWLRCVWWRNGQENIVSRFYHRLLVWDLLKKPKLTRVLEHTLNPILGKSVVVYLQQHGSSE